MKHFKEKKILQYAAVFVMVSLIYVMWRLMLPNEKGIRIFMGILIAGEAVFDLIMLKQKKLLQPITCRLFSVYRPMLC